MLAFHSDKKIKKSILMQLRSHAKADEIVKGMYWVGGKGCAVGCTLHSGNHAEYEPRFGIPQMLARLEDSIFEGLPNNRAKVWPVQFMNAIAPGADLSLVGWKFLHWLLVEEKVNPGINHPLVRDAVKRCVDVIADLANGKQINQSAAESAAGSAVGSARSASAAGSWSAARSAESAAWSAEWSAGSAVGSAAAGSAVGSARENVYVLMADKLLGLLSEAPV